MQLVAVLVTGAIGYTAADVIDRLVTTRQRKDAQGNVLPMVWETTPLSNDLIPRVGAGILVAGFPLVAAHFISSPMGRSAVQGFGVGAAIRLIGKGIDDLAAYLFKDSAQDSYGRKLFGTEIMGRQHAGLTGLGAAPCGNCGKPAGLGSCGCRSMLPSGVSTGPMPPAFPPGTNLPPSGPYVPTSPPVVNNQDPFTPPGITVRQPGTPRIPATPGLPATPTTPGVPPTIAIPGTPPTSVFYPSPASPYPQPVVGVNGLGDVGQAQQVLRHYEAAYRAITANRTAFAAVRNGLGSPAQQQTVGEITRTYADGIRAIGQFNPATIASAARGLGFLEESKPMPKFPGARRHREDDAAE